MEVYISDGQLKRKRCGFRFKIYLTLGILWLAFTGIFYFVVVSRAFRITVETNGLRHLKPENVLSKIYSRIFQNPTGRLLGTDNYFAWPKKLEIDEPLVANLSVVKNLLEKKIVLTFEERQPYGIFCVKNPNYQLPITCYWFDKEGIVFEPAPIPDGHLILKVISDAETRIYAGNSIVKTDFAKPLFKILSYFKTADSPAIQEYFLKNSLQEVHAKTADGVSIFFSLRFDPDNSLAALRSLYGKTGFKNAAYIDLTVENRVYIKNR